MQVCECCRFLIPPLQGPSGSADSLEQSVNLSRYYHSLKSPLCSCVSCNLGKPRKHCSSNFSRCWRRREHQLLIRMPNPSISSSSSARASSFAPSSPIPSTSIPRESMQPRHRSWGTRIADPHFGQTIDDSCRWKQTSMLFIGNATI